MKNKAVLINHDKVNEVEIKLVEDYSIKKLDPTKEEIEIPITINNNFDYGELVKTFQKIEATTKRLEMRDILSQFLLQIIQKEPSILLPVIYLCINRIGPDHEGLELGIGETILIKAIAQSTGRTVSSIKSSLSQTGDLGKVALESRQNQTTMFQPKKLTIFNVFKTFKEIASITGNSSMQKKIDKIQFLMVSGTQEEVRFIIRSLEGNLRIGLAEKTVLTALAHAIILSENKINKDDNRLTEASEVLKAVYNELPNYDVLIPALLEHGMKDINKYCKLTSGIPIKPMLAHPTKSLGDVLTRFENIDFICEYKYDGERAQIHRDEKGETFIFSRNSENMTQKYPDISSNISYFVSKDVISFILDCEAVAWDKENNCLLPFQVLTTRKRKDVKEEDIKVQVCIFAFDILYLNGKSLLKVPLKERKEILYANFIESPGKMQFAKSMVSNDVEEIQIFLDESIKDKCEGLMLKTLEGKEASYEPSLRSRNWLKVKKDYISGIGDSLDLVVIGAYSGRGKRTGFYGGFLLACYNPEKEEYESVCKIGTGFSDIDLEFHFNNLKPYLIDSPKSYYKLNLESTKPDYWFEPNQVWEVKAADLSISPIYKAAVGIVDDTKGISLRFPRFLKIREDKTPETCTNSQQVANLYNNQSFLSNDKESKDMDLDYEY